MDAKVTSLLRFIVAASLATNVAVGADRTANASGHVTVGSTGFLEPTRVPPDLDRRSDPEYDFLCAAAASTLQRLNCPFSPAEKLTSRNFQPPSQIGQYLPHLRIHIALDRIEHHAVSGGGIDNNADLNQFWLQFELDSNAAMPGEAEPGAGFPVFLEPGESTDQPRHLWTGQIPNGCSAATYVDLHLYSKVYRDGGSGGTLGEVDLDDHFTGNGNYGVFFTIHAVEDDESSDFVYRGYLQAYCSDYLWEP